MTFVGHQFPGVHAPLQTADGSAHDCPYWPAGHGEHDGERATLYCPGPHVVCVGDGEPASHAYPALQLLQPLHPDSEYWPAAHWDCVADGDATPQ